MICHRHRAISILLSYNPDLLDFIFSSCRRLLRHPGRTLVRESILIGPQEHLLTKIALDLWDGKIRTSLIETVTGLDRNRYECLVAAMEYYQASAAHTCRACYQHTAKKGTDHDQQFTSALQTLGDHP